MRKKRWIPAALWATVIFMTSCFYIPTKQFVRGVVKTGGGRVSQASFDSFWHSWWWLFVKGYHVFEYTLLCILLVHALSQLPKLKAIGYAAAISFLYASTDEWHQTFVKDRGGKWTDVAIDSIGIALVVVITWIHHLVVERRTQTQGSSVRFESE